MVSVQRLFSSRGPLGPAADPRRRGGPLPALLVLVLVLVPAGCGDGGDRAEGRLPPVAYEATVLDLLAEFADGRVAIEASHPDFPLALHPPHFVPETALASDSDRLVLRAHAPSAFTVTTPVLGRGARLHARTMVYPAVRDDALRSDPVPLTFRIAVDGVEQVALRSDYILESRANVYDQYMRELDVDLAPWEGRSVTLRLATTRDVPLPAGSVAPEPLWWSAVVEQRLEVPRQTASPEAPNLLVLCVDTLSARRMSLHGHARSTTPRLAEFAAGGTVFEMATSPASWTLPATASLFTGLPPNTHGVLGDGRDFLMDALVTWPELLREEGLVGAAFAANPLVAPATNFHQGFEHFELDEGSGMADADAEALNRRFLAWLDQQPADGRWFAYVHTIDPHAPYGPPRGRTRYAGDYVERRSFEGHLPGQLQQGQIPPFAPDEQQHVADLYDAEVAYFDETFGALLDALDARGELQRTVIVVTSDHGEELFEHGRLGHGYALTEVMLRVPLVLAGPGVPAGRRVTTPVSTAALHNTLLVLAGLEPVQGAARPLLPLDDVVRRGEAVHALTRTSLFGDRRLLVSARDVHGRKVVLEYDERGEAERARQFFDLDADPLEARPVDVANLLGDEAAAFERLAEQAAIWHQASRSARPAGRSGGSDLSSALHALGYLGGGGEDDTDAADGADADSDERAHADHGSAGGQDRRPPEDAAGDGR